MLYSLNSLKGGYVGDYMGACLGVMNEWGYQGFRLWLI